MVNCSKLRKQQCIDTSQGCEWVVGKGCKKKQEQSKENFLELIEKLKLSHKLSPAKQKVNPKQGFQKLIEKMKLSDESSIDNVKHCPSTKCENGEALMPDGLNCKELMLVGKGTFGCVITPPISENTFVVKEIIPYRDKHNTDIGKLFIKGYRDYMDELKILQLVQKLDPYSKFTTKLKGTQKISGQCLKYNYNVMKCLERSKNIGSKLFYQIILENGGLKSDAFYNITYKQFLKFFKTFIEGMIILQNNKIAHRDIKPDNVLVNDTKISLIDFGIATKMNQVYQPSERSLLKYTYEYVWYPPEFYVAYKMFDYRSLFNGRKDEFNKFVDKIPNILTDERFYQQKFRHLPYIDMIKGYEQGVNDFLNTIKASDKSRVEDVFTEEIAQKADVFSVAYIISSMNKNIQYNSNAEKQFVNNIFNRTINSNPYDRISFKELYTMLEDEIAKPKSTVVLGGNTKTLKTTTVDKVPYLSYMPTPVPRKTSRRYTSKKKTEKKSSNKKSKPTI
jgi:serine/threonine protein kinase